MAFFNEFPHTRTYDSDLGWIIKEMANLLIEWGGIEKAWEEFLKNFGNSVEEATKKQLEEWLNDGTLETIIEKYITSIPFINVKDYGAKGDGVSDDGKAIINAINASGEKNIIYFPPGTYIIENTEIEGYENTGIVIEKSNIILIGNNRNSILKSKTGHLQVISISNSSNLTIKNLVIDGNAINYASGEHCIRINGTRNLKIINCEIMNPSRYGIGFEGGKNEEILIDSCYIHDTGADGIDMKNFDSLNNKITINNNYFYNIGLDQSLNYQACIDIRGTGVAITNNLAKNIGVSSLFIRMRETTEEQGIGGIKNIISNCILQGNQTGGTGTGINCYEGTEISNCEISGVSVGIMVGLNCVVSNCLITDVFDGIRTNGNNSIIHACIIKNSSANAIRISNDGYIIDSCLIDKANRGLFFNTNVKNTIVSNNNVFNCENYAVGDSEAKYINNKGIMEFDLTKNIDVSTVGIKNIEFSFDLPITPINFKFILVSDSNAVINLGQITNITNRNINVNVNVVTAGSGEATLRLVSL